MRIPIGTGTSKGRSIPLTAERLVNMYAEMAPSGAKSQVVVHGCPGLTLFADIDTRRTRGLYRTSSDGRLYVVVRNTLYYVDPEGVAMDLGTIAGSGRVGMSDNGTQLCIVAGATGYTYTVAGGLQVITDPDFPGADTVTFLDGFFAFNNASAGQRGQFFISNLLDGQMYDALDFATAEAYPDNLIRVFADHSQLLLFGAETIEVWFNAGLADFPFTRAQGSVIEQGLGARWSVAKLDETVVWLDNEGMVRSLQGNTPVRISTHAIEYEITRGDWNNATAWSYVEEGHQFYVLTVPAADLATQKAGTYVYDAATQLWHERKSYRQDYSRSGFYAYAYGKHITADIDLGRLYVQNLDVYQENGEHLIAEMQLPQVQNDGMRFIVDELQLDMEVGSQLKEVAVLSETTWTQQSVPQQNAWQEIVWSPDLGLFCAVSADGTNRVITSPDGKNWTARNAAQQNQWDSIEWSPGLGLFCAVSIDGSSRVMTSSDGISWSPVNVPLNIWRSVVWSPTLGFFCAVSASGTSRCIRSSDGSNWFNDSPVGGLPADAGWQGVTWSESLGIFCAVASSGSNRIAYSANGFTWTPVAAPEQNSWQEITWSPGLGLFCAVSVDGVSRIMISPDAINWTAINVGTEGYSDVAWSPELGVFCAVSRLGSNKALTSKNGVDWFPSDTPNIQCEGVAWSPELMTFCAVGVSGDARVMTSSQVRSEIPVYINGDPQVMLDESGDTRTFDMNQNWRSMGKKGEYGKRVIWRRRGQHRSYTARIAISAPVKRAIFAAYAKIRPSKS